MFLCIVKEIWIGSYESPLDLGGDLMVDIDRIDRSNGKMPRVDVLCFFLPLFISIDRNFMKHMMVMIIHKW